MDEKYFKKFLKKVSTDLKTGALMIVILHGITKFFS